jgi:erythromycin esterase-like protein
MRTLGIDTSTAPYNKLIPNTKGWPYQPNSIFYQGSVTAASAWDGEAERKLVLPAIKESYEHMFHQTGIGDFLLLLQDNHKLAPYLNLSRLQRAIGVLYLPQSERMSHYYFSKLPEQFDAIIHIDHSHAVKPLETTGLWHETELLETYPTGL